MAKTKAPPPPPPKKEEYIKFERADPSLEQQELVMEMAVKKGLRPGTLGAIIDHESRGTWHPWIRPSDPRKPPVRITVDGEVRGEPGSTAAGIAQYINATWLRSLYVHGDDVIADAELEKYDPAAATTIRKAREVTAKELKGRSPDWNSFDAMGKKLKDNKDIAAALALRTQTSSRVSIAVLANDLVDYKKQIEGVGLEGNTTNLYILHHKDLGLLRQLTKNPDYVAADDPKMREAVAKNGTIFTSKDGVAKSGAETYQTYSNLVSDGHASRFERSYYGRDFGRSMENDRPMVLRDQAGHGYTVRRDLIMPPRLDATQFVAEWKKPQVIVEKPENLSGTVRALRKLGYDFGKSDPQDFDNPRLRTAIGAFKAQLGLPFAEKGQLDVITKNHLAHIETDADMRIVQQAHQREVLNSDGSLNLRKLPKDDVIKQQILDLKTKLAAKGLLKQPIKFERIKGPDRKTRTVPRELPFDGTVDNKLIGALSLYQQRNGLMDTKGILDPVTRQQLGVETAAPVAPVKKSALDDGGKTPSEHFAEVIHPSPDTAVVVGLAPTGVMDGPTRLSMMLSSPQADILPVGAPVQQHVDTARLQASLETPAPVADNSAGRPSTGKPKGPQLS